MAEHGDEFKGEALEYLARIRTGSERMSGLIDGLLELSRVGRDELHRETVDLSALAREVAEELSVAEPGRTVEVEVQADLGAHADPDLSRLVVQNLMANAWKFTVAEKPAHVDFGATDNGAFFVRDNGAGFDMAYARKLFNPFQRLHRVEEFPGTGVGLATVQRIVARHGGRIWADGAPGAGASFFFTLPVRVAGEGARGDQAPSIA
jgi:light-regulated signal transduction histidine kinase (bacteriophytochrome)